MPASTAAALYREILRASLYSFDHRGVHFVALDNVSRAKPEIGSEQLEWLKKDLARFSKSSPIVVFTHRPLFDLRPDWEWFTSDGDDVMNVLSAYEQRDRALWTHSSRRRTYDRSRPSLRSSSLIFAFPRPCNARTAKADSLRQRSPVQESRHSLGGLQR